MADQCLDCCSLPPLNAMQHFITGYGSYGGNVNGLTPADGIPVATVKALGDPDQGFVFGDPDSGEVFGYQ